MNALTDTPLLSYDDVERTVLARDREMANPFTKDLQVTALRGARRYRGDRLVRVASPHRLLDPKAGPLIAVKLHLLTRKTLGGLETDLDARVLKPDGAPLPGVYAAGEVAGFGGGGHARLPRAGGDVPRRLPVLRPYGGARCCAGHRLRSTDGVATARTHRSAGLGRRAGLLAARRRLG